MKVCPRCGRTEREVPFIGFFCRDCYLELHPPIQEIKVTLKVCPTCGRVFVGRWVEPSAEKIARWIQDHVRVSPDVERPLLSITLGKEDEKGIEFFGILRGTIKGTPVEHRFKGVVEKVKEQCPYCARRAGGYYEAVLQLRGSRWQELYRYVLEYLSRESDPKAFIAKEVPRRKGVDIFLGSKKVAEKIARRVKKKGASVKFSFQMVTEKDGKPITREFVALRLE